MLKGKELKEYISACDCEEIQGKWEQKDKTERSVFYSTKEVVKGYMEGLIYSDYKQKGYIFLPTLEQLWSIAGKILKENAWAIVFGAFNSWWANVWFEVLRDNKRKIYSTQQLALVAWIKEMGRER